MRFLVMLLFAFSALFSSEVASEIQSQNLEIYKTQISDLELAIIPLAKSNPPVEKLIANNNNDKKFIAKMAKSLPQNYQNIMLIRHKNFIALVDTGFPRTIETLRAQLKKLNLTPHDITHLIITHAHIDHIGGILRNGKNQFINATMLIDKREYDFWINSDNTSAKSALGAFKDKVAFFNQDKDLNKSLGLETSDVRLATIPSYGHTPGHTMISIANGEKRLIFIADLMHIFDIQMAHPNIAIQYDSDPNEAIKARIAFFDSLKKGDSKGEIQIIGAHLPFVEPRVIRGNLINF